jgi:hypothetical protein
MEVKDSPWTHEVRRCSKCETDVHLLQEQDSYVAFLALRENWCVALPEHLTRLRDPQIRPSLPGRNDILVGVPSKEWLRREMLGSDHD